MSGFGDFAEDTVLGLTLLGSGGLTFVNTSVRYIGLIGSLNGSTDAATYSEVMLNNATTATSVGYGRVPTSPVGWTAPSGGAVQNALTMTWSEAINTPWGTVAYIGIYDTVGVGTGHLLFYTTLTNTRVVDIGDTFQIPAANLTVAIQ